MYIVIVREYVSLHNIYIYIFQNIILYTMYYLYLFILIFECYMKMEHYTVHAFKAWMFRLCIFICGEMLVVATGSGRGLAMKALWGSKMCWWSRKVVMKEDFAIHCGRSEQVYTMWLWFNYVLLDYRVYSIYNVYSCIAVYTICTVLFWAGASTDICWRRGM